MKNKVARSIIRTLAVGFVAASATIAHAGPIDETYVAGKARDAATVRLRFDANELASADGREALIKRIDRASRRVCGSFNVKRAGGLKVAMRNRACYEESLGHAMTQLDALQHSVALSPAQSNHRGGSLVVSGYSS